MAANPERLRFYVDESTLGLGTSGRVRPRYSSLLRPVCEFSAFGVRDTTTWGWLEWLVRQWDELEEIIRTRGPGPWFYVIYEHRIVELPLRPGVTDQDVATRD